MQRLLLVNEADGSQIIFIKKWCDSSQADKLLERCRALETKHYNFKWYGRPLKQTRLLWACGDKGTFHEFGGETVAIAEWDSAFASVRERLVKEFDVYTNFCLVNHYRNGLDSIALHSDGELHAKNKSVFTLSLGATRKMKLLDTRTNREILINLEHGDLLLMCGNTQSHWKHGIDVEPLVKDARYSLTLRSTKLKV